jgi:hypothetical protein
MKRNSKTQLRLFTLAAALTLVACSLFSAGQEMTPTPAQDLGTASLPTGTETPVELAPSPTPTETSPPPTDTQGPPTESPNPTHTPEPAGPSPTPLNPESTLVIEAIQMIDPQGGWAIGGAVDEAPVRVLRTTDGGRTFRDVSPQWTQPESPETNVTATGFFWNMRLGWVVYTASGPDQPIPQPPAVWFTRDGGQSWSPGGDLPLNGGEGYFDHPILTFSTPQNGWLLAHVDAGMSHDYIDLFRTTDGGATWQMVMDPFSLDSPQACGKTGLTFADSLYGWLTKDCGGVIDGVSLDFSTDGGATWTNRQLPPPEGAADFFNTHVCGAYDPMLFSDQSGVLGVRCFLMADFNQHVDYVYFTEDGGTTWETHSYPGGQLFFLDPQLGWAFDRKIHQTTDGGGSWMHIMTTQWDGQFSFVDALHGWAVATKTNDDGTLAIALVQTVNGGGRWALLEPVLAGP